MQQGERRQDWASLVEEQIRQAQERGAFDNLPGAGQPLALTANPYAKDREMAFKILQDAGLAPEWIELGKIARERLDRARATLAHRREGRQARLAELEGRSDGWAAAERQRALTAWERAVQEFHQEVERINRTLFEYNLKVPGAQFQRCLIDGKREIEKLEREHPL